MSDDISLKVQEQYETFPYTSMDQSGKTLRQQTVGERFREIGISVSPINNNEIENPKILIAGCGTGQHSVEVAQRFKNSEVISVDLSRSS